ncbi:MAG: homoserine kinase type [Aliidongia sp.]|jgi:homoserine kinase type II|nr:homoserine kinase type [Aliidongia sp.]
MAVYTDISDGDLTRFLAEYDLGAALSCKGIAEGVENSNFLIRTEQGSFILTLYEKRVNPGDLPFFIGLMEHLAARGFSCPTPIRGRDGIALRRLCNRPAAVVSFLEGLWPRDILPVHCTGVGDALARLHAAGADFAMVRPNDLSIEGWQPLIAATAAEADSVAPGLAGELAREMVELKAAWPRDLPAGLCHADFFPDNVFFRDEQVSGVIDFYFACTDALAYDLAICLNAWCFEADLSWNETKGKWLIDAYQAIRPLTPAERSALPVLARGAALRFLLTRLFDWLNRAPGALVRPKNPLEYLTKLRFHRTAGPETYGL